jgi:hypothetical protein
MQFNQTNNNLGGDVNNVIAENGNIVQSTGDQNKVEVDKPKSGFWSELWAKIKGAWKWIRGV